MLGCTATENVMYGIMLNPKNDEASRYSQQLLTYNLQESDEWQVSAKLQVQQTCKFQGNVEMLPQYFYICIITNPPALDY